MKPQKNVAQGFYDEFGFHPIRASKDYNEFLGGDYDSDRHRARRELRRESARRESYRRREEEEAAIEKRERRGSGQKGGRGRSLSQYVRAQGGIVPTEDLAGELRRLGKKESGTTGLINKENKLGGRRAVPEYMMDQAEADGYGPFASIGDFLEAVELDATGRRKVFSMATNGRKKRGAQTNGRRKKLSDDALFSMFAVESAKPKGGGTVTASQLAKREGAQRVKSVHNNEQGKVLKKFPDGWLKIKLDSYSKPVLAAPGEYSFINPSAGRVRIHKGGATVTPRKPATNGKRAPGKATAKNPSASIASVKKALGSGVVNYYLSQPNARRLVMNDANLARRNGEKMRAAALDALLVVMDKRPRQNGAKDTVRRLSKELMGRVPRKVKEIRERFLGRPHSRVIPEGAMVSKHVTRGGQTWAVLGTLRELQYAGTRIENLPNNVKLLANGRGKLAISGLRFPTPKGLKPNQLLNQGYLEHVVYNAQKSHLHGGKRLDFIHELGEESGRMPKFCLDHEGFPVISGGAYKIEAAGIVD